ncbi:MAG: glycerate kinase type-2 family protein [Thermomicrobiales bacterium]
MTSVLDGSEARELVARMFAGGVASADPRAAVRAHLALRDGVVSIGGRDIVLGHGRIIALAVGKAAVPMALGLRDVLGERIDVGIALTKDDHVPAGADLPRFAVREASHPVPDERGVQATREMLDLVRGLGPDDTVLALISGGGSALLEAPAGDLTLADIQAVTSALLRAGAPIQDLNAVRSELSLVKGGGLRRAIGPARCLSLILSDVLGNDPAVIASGPTVERSVDPARAMALLAHYGVRESIPPAVTAWLSRNGGDGRDQRVHHPDDVWAVMADNASFVEAMGEVARGAGHRTEIGWRDIEGEARERGAAFVERCAGMPEDVDVVLGGGETTVTVRGGGIGGRNTEFALAAAIMLDAACGDHWVIASLASDGDDGGNRGAAGAVVDAGTITRSRELGLDAEAALAANDSGTLLAATGDLFRCDLTGTNVNDAYLGVRIRRRS